MDLVAIHSLDYTTKDYVKDSCCHMLNVEWPRSHVLRMRSLNSSCNDFPMCLALMSSTLVDSDGNPVVLGHVRMTRIPTIPRGVWIESVILHPDLRGRGYGKYLMLKAEEFALSRGFNEAYLNTIDQQVFYSRIGYQFCDPVCAYGGNSKLVSGITSSRVQFDPPQPPQTRRKPTKIEVPKWASSDNNRNCEKEGSNTKSSAPQPPPPPPPPAPSAGKESSPPEPCEDLKQKCLTLRKYVTLKDVTEPVLDSPLRCLKKDAEEKAQAKKLDKDAIHRISLPKHYMKKELL